MNGACLFEAIFKQLDIKLPDQKKYTPYSLRKQMVVLMIREMKVSSMVIGSNQGYCMYRFTQISFYFRLSDGTPSKMSCGGTMVWVTKASQGHSQQPSSASEYRLHI